MLRNRCSLGIGVHSAFAYSGCLRIGESCSSASILIAQDCQPKFIQEHLAYSSITVTMDRRGHLYPEARNEIAPGFDAAYSSVSVIPA